MPNQKDTIGKKEPAPESNPSGTEAQLSEDTKLAVSNAVQEFSELVKKYGGSNCDRFVLTALLHPEVQQSFALRIEAKDIFIGVQCTPSISEEIHVVFDFRCAPPKISLLPTRFLAVLDAFTGRLIRIVDPFNPLIEQYNQEASRTEEIRPPSAAPAPPPPSFFPPFNGNPYYYNWRGY